MGKIYCVMGKSSSGKDSIYSRIMQQGNPALLRIVPYTTRPRREGETDGREYVFTDETHVQQLESAGKVIELRAYYTVYGIWKYFTVDDGRIDLSAHSYLYIVTLEGYQKIQRYFGSSRVVPIYIEVEDGESCFGRLPGSGSRKLRSMRKCAGDFLRMQPIFPRKS